MSGANPSPAVDLSFSEGGALSRLGLAGRPKSADEAAPSAAQFRGTGATGWPSAGGPPARAFSLLEVVIAVGIFAFGMMAVVGLFTPVAKSVTGIIEAEAATNVAELLNARLQGQPLTEVEKLLKNATAKGHELIDTDARPDYDIAADPQLLFASRDGLKIGTFSDTVWSGSNREKFFEIALIRNETLSPQPATTTDDAGNPTTTNSVATAAVLAYTARVRWPAFVADTGTGWIQIGINPTGAVKFDHSQKQVLFFAGSITR